MRELVIDDGGEENFIVEDIHVYIGFRCLHTAEYISAVMNPYENMQTSINALNIESLESITPTYPSSSICSPRFQM